MTRLGRAAFALTLSFVLLALTLVLMPSAGQHVAQGHSMNAPTGVRAALNHPSRTMTPWVAIAGYPVFAYRSKPVTVTVAWGDVPTDGRYVLRVQLENKLQWPHYYTWTDVISYSTTETRTITLPAPADAGSRCGSRFVAAFISPIARNPFLCRPQ